MAGSGMGWVLKGASARYASGLLYATTRHDHSMAVPALSKTGQIGLWPLSSVHKQLSKNEQSVFSTGSLAFAYSDWAGYSVFGEAFTLGHMTGENV